VVGHSLTYSFNEKVLPQLSFATHEVFLRAFSWSQDKFQQFDYQSNDLEESQQWIIDDSVVVVRQGNEIRVDVNEFGADAEFLVQITQDKGEFWLEYPENKKQDISLIVCATKETGTDNMIPYEVKELDILKFGRLRFLVRYISGENEETNMVEEKG